jgi:hypothetical protein
MVDGPLSPSVPCGGHGMVMAMRSTCGLGDPRYDTDNPVCANDMKG